jgi:hypothetical protein
LNILAFFDNSLLSGPSYLEPNFGANINLIGSASPVSQEQQQIGVDTVNTPVWSDNDSSPEESEKKEGRIFWSE